jgi:hypothetical protein
MSVCYYCLLGMESTSTCAYSSFGTPMDIALCYIRLELALIDK